MDSFSHLDSRGNAIMVNVGGKPDTERTAVAESVLKMRPETLSAIRSAAIKKGDVYAAARIAGIMAAKKTAELIPLCHVIPIESVTIDFSDDGISRLFIQGTAKCHYKTGIEMEALTAVSVAALTVYDMCKAIDRGMEIESVRLLKKTGGKSDYLYERQTEQND